jgi:hypothetical protein
MTPTRGKLQELKEIEGLIDDLYVQVTGLKLHIGAQPDLAEVSGPYDMKTDVGVIFKALDNMTGTLYKFGLDKEFIAWKNIK